MATIADLLIKVSADTGGAEKDISSFGSKVAGGFRKSLLPATAALGVMGVVGKAAFQNLQDGAKNAKQTEQVIKTTGGAANVTAKHVDDLAMSLRRKAGVDDDVVHSGENMLLTFTNVKNGVGSSNQIFDKATGILLDMSQALGQDTKNSAIQLGKALNDPITGVGALSRVGVTFTEQQKKQIKTLVDSGKTMDAQKIILHELGREFGGAATNIDPMQKNIANLKLDSIDFASSLVQALMPALQDVVGMLQQATTFLQDHETVAKIVVSVIAGLALGIIAVNAAMKAYAAGQAVASVAMKIFTTSAEGENAALEANPIGIVIVALIALGAALVVLYMKSETFRKIVNETWSSIKSATTSTISFLEGLWARFGDKITSVARTAFGLVQTIVGGELNVIRGIINVVVGLIHGDWGRAWDGIKQIVSGAFTAMTAVIRKVGPLLAAEALKLGKAIADGVLSGVENLGKDLGEKLGSAAKSAFDHAKGLLHIHSPSGLAADEIGKPIADGVILGWVNGAAALPTKMADSLQTAIDSARQRVDNARSSFTDSFGGLVSIADNAFDAINSSAQTKTEGLLGRIVSNHDASEFKANLADARSAVVAAKGDLATFKANPNPDGSSTPAEVAQKRLDLGAAVRNAEKQVDDLLYQQKVAALQKQATTERLNLDAQQAVRKQHFDSALTALSTSLSKEGATSGTATQEVLKLLGSFGVNFKDVGTDMGTAWVKGLKESIESAAGGSGKLAGTISSAAAGIKVPGHANGVRNFGGGLSVVGERGPELVNLPRGADVLSNRESRGMFGGVNIHGDLVVREEADVRLVARELAMRLGA